MSTAIELEALPEAYQAVKDYGTTATFTLYPSATSDEVDSEVDLGAPQVHTVRIIPPDMLESSFSEDGSQLENEGVRFDMMTGALTAEAISFVPSIGDRVAVAGKNYRVRSVSPEISGHHVAYYTIEARA